MGLPMSINLQKAGFKVTGFEINPERKAFARESGITTAESIREAVTGADWVMTSLPKTEHVEKVLHMKDGIFESAKPGAYILDSSTISPVAIIEFNQEAKARSCVFLDSPCSGATKGAQAGTLTFMVGGEQTEFETAKHFLKGMGTTFIHCGQVGCGSMTKLVNNYQFATSMVALAEGLSLAEKLGLDPKVVFDVVSQCEGNSFSVD